MKSEPDAYSIKDLEQDGQTFWDGVRNYQARNFLRDQIKVGDEVLFYHSNATPPGVVGLARVVREGYPDHTAFEPDDPHYDPKSDPTNPRWFMVDVEFVEAFDELIPLSALKEAEGLEEMVLNKRSRLSVQPVTPHEFRVVVSMSKRK
jgi:predicted RNA-binding protein with PUA-like domain